VVVLGPGETERSFGFTEAGARFAAVDIADRPRPPADLRAIGELRRALAGAHVVHAHGLRAGGLAALALTGRRRPALVVTLHNARPAGGRSGTVYSALERLVAREASVVMAVSADLEAAMRSRGAGDVRHALVPAPPSATGLAAPADIRRDLGVDADVPLVLAAGRLASQKGYPLLLDAATRWADLTPRPMVLVAGEGPLHEELAARIAAEELPVRLLGRRDDVPSLLAAADVFVLPSVWEGQPLAAQEALRVGVPIVATAVGGVPEVVGDAAVLTPYGDADALAAAVARVLSDPVERERLRAAALTRAAELPDDEDAVDQVEALFREVVGRS
jgi:glycosyltransferase involved in cell wall biosynthesis